MYYAITKPGAGYFVVDDTQFVESIEDAAAEALASDAESADEIEAFEADEMHIEAPNVEDMARDALEGVDADFRDGLMVEMADAVTAAQKLLDDAFAQIDARGLWIRSNRKIDRERIAAAFEAERAKGGANAEGEVAYRDHDSPF